LLPARHCWIRNRALILVLWRPGLRITQSLKLKPSDVDLDQEDEKAGSKSKEKIIKSA